LGALPSVRSKSLLAALLKGGFMVVRTRGSHRFLRHADGRTLLFAFHDRETVGPRMLTRVLKDAGLRYEEIERLI
jgi:predicted RNA binding protein YcfA (HicA-like mRNA interferase family)